MEIFFGFGICLEIRSLLLLIIITYDCILITYYYYCPAYGMVLEGKTKQVCVTGAHCNWTGWCSSNLRWSWRSWGSWRSWRTWTANCDGKGLAPWNDTWAESFNNLSLAINAHNCQKVLDADFRTLITDSGCWAWKVVCESIQINKCGNTEHLHDMCNTILVGFCKFLFG